jgi:hypothetical protein
MNRSWPLQGHQYPQQRSRVPLYTKRLPSSGSIFAQPRTSLHKVPLLHQTTLGALLQQGQHLHLTAHAALLLAMQLLIIPSNSMLRQTRHPALP